jgi:hypothetical protein
MHLQYPQGPRLPVLTHLALRAGCWLWLMLVHASSQRGPRGSVSAVALRLLSGQSGHDEGILRRMTNVSGGLQRTLNIGIFRATIKGNQPHAIRALNLITVLEPIDSIRKKLPAIGADDLDPIGHRCPFSTWGRIQLRPLRALSGLTVFLAPNGFQRRYRIWSVQNRSIRYNDLFRAANSSCEMPPTCSTVLTCF